MLDNFKKKFNQFYNTLVHPFKSLWIFLLYRVLSWRLKNTKKKKEEEISLKRERHEAEAIIELLKKKKKVKACVIASTR